MAYIIARAFRGSDMRVTEHNPKTTPEHPISPATTGCTRDRLSHHGSCSAKYRQLLLLQCHKLAIYLLYRFFSFVIQSTTICILGIMSASKPVLGDGVQGSSSRNEAAEASPDRGKEDNPHNEADEDEGQDTEGLASEPSDRTSTVAPPLPEEAEPPLPMAAPPVEDDGL